MLDRETRVSLRGRPLTPSGERLACCLSVRVVVTSRVLCGREMISEGAHSTSLSVTRSTRCEAKGTQKHKLASSLHSPPVGHSGLKGRCASAWCDHHPLAVRHVRAHSGCLSSVPRSYHRCTTRSVTICVSPHHVRRDYPLNLSISVSGGKETKWDSLSSGERKGMSPAHNVPGHPA